MRDTLSRFCEEIGCFHADCGNDPALGSLAVTEQAAFPRPESVITAWSMATMLIELGGEHITAFVKTITAPVEPIACLTCVRSMLEPCALASWLLDPCIDAHARVGRVFALRYKGMEQELKFTRATGGSGKKIRARISEVEQDALKLGYARIVNAKGERYGIGERMPSATEVIKLMLNEESMYRLLSAVTHGHVWAIRGLGFKPRAKSSLSRDVGGVPVTMFEKTVDTKALALFGFTAATAFAKPVWYKCNYAGWDKERLTGVLDSTFDELGAQSSSRFWCHRKG